MSLVCDRKLGHFEEAHMVTERTCKLHTDSDGEQYWILDSGTVRSNFTGSTTVSAAGSGQVAETKTHIPD